MEAVIMPLTFRPNYQITQESLNKLFEIDTIQKEVINLPLTAKVLAGLRESSKLISTHYSTQIEGNRLTAEQVARVLKEGRTIPGRERDAKEVRGYYLALDQLKVLAKKTVITEEDIQLLHGFVMGSNIPNPYRTGQNVIKDAETGYIVYMPPEAKDVPALMKGLVNWLNQNKSKLPIPVLASIAHYQFVTIHPYYDGNGRTARLLTTLLLHQGGYDLKGIYNLEEYYAKDLPAYYAAMTLGPSHNYYEGRAETDITPWVDYFLSGMLHAFKNVKKHLIKENTSRDDSEWIKNLDAKQRRALVLFNKSNFITSKELEELFQFSARAARQLAQKWVNEGFLMIADNSKKNRKYKLGK